MVKYHIQGNQFPALAEGQAYEHLGIPAGYHVDQSSEDTIERMSFELERLDTTLLPPWQKIDALSTFILSKISFVLRGCDLADEFGGDGGDIPSVWSRVRNATRIRLSKRPDVKWLASDDTLSIQIGRENYPGSFTIAPPTRQHLEWRLKEALRNLARQAKQEKYNGLAEQVRTQGYETTVDAFIGGVLGTWDPENEKVRSVPKIRDAHASPYVSPHV
ncbi:hypothetical protein JTB14_014962 [Gonioctena quinquepunctata]|nr:hypothetical protein JTB14_014962 [Gonioctena quinquepunctata]